MADPLAPREAPRTETTASREASRAAVERFLTLTGEVRGAAILEAGEVLAASGNATAWRDAGKALLDAADAAAGSRASHAHVATEEGEVFAARTGSLEMVAVMTRFALASLVFADMRAALRQALATEHAAEKRAA